MYQVRRCQDGALHSSREKSASESKNVDLLLLLPHVLVGDLVSEFELALLLSEMRVDREEGLVYDGIRFPGSVIPGSVKSERNVSTHFMKGADTTCTFTYKIYM